MARKPTKKEDKSMSDNDLAAELGLDTTEVSNETQTENTGAAPATAEKQTRTAVKIGEIKRGKLSAIPTISRAQNDTESKYAVFGELVAPGEDGFDSAFVEYDATEDEDRFRRSVQAAYTKETAAAKAAGKPNKYIGRASTDDAGKLLGIYVIRVDGHDVKGDA